MILNWLIGIFVFIFGLCIGSFLNVVIYRTETDKSFLKGRSFCPNCNHTLNWQDLFPLFSFLFLGGKCRYCKAKISWQYPAVELITGIIFLLISLQTTNYKLLTIINLLFLLYITSVLIVIFVYDLKHYLIPDNVLLPAIIISIIYRIFEVGFSMGLINYFYAVLAGTGFFFMLWLLSGGRWMGFGDVKLAILLGLLLGMPNILVGLFLAFFSGAIIGVGLLSFKKKNIKSEVPFGPFLIFGTFMALFYGQKIVNWYFNLIL